MDKARLAWREKETASFLLKVGRGGNGPVRERRAVAKNRWHICWSEVQESSIHFLEARVKPGRKNGKRHGRK